MKKKPAKRAREWHLAIDSGGYAHSTGCWLAALTVGKHDSLRREWLSDIKAHWEGSGAMPEEFRIIKVREVLPRARRRKAK